MRNNPGGALNAIQAVLSYFLDKGDRRYYRFVIPTKKPVSHVETEIFDQYKDKYTQDSIVICNR
jgi:C-terminal processing protease CtpA/Prc